MSIEERIKKTIASTANLKIAEVQPDKTFKDDLDMDSLSEIELIMALEEEFNIEIPDEVIDKMITVQDLIDYVKKKV